MLKKICGLFLGLVVCIGSACVTPTHASSAFPVIITHIQAGGVGAAREEFVLLYNATPNDIDISGWCLTNKYDVSFFCFDDELTGYILPAEMHAVITSAEFIETTTQLFDVSPYVYTVTNQSSGSIVGSADIISLIDSEEETVDVKSWATSLASGKMWARQILMDDPLMYAELGGEADWLVETSGELPLNEVVEYEKEPEEPIVKEPELVQAGGHPAQLSELLPNPDGADTGNEFIELYNPNEDMSIDLTSYTVKVGQSLEKTYTFPEGSVVAPQEYKAFTNAEMSFTLLNSTSSVQLYANEVPVGEQVTYIDPESGMAWAYIENTWTYTTTPTPNEANILTVASEEVEESELKPCADNQYRSLETNRCRLIATTESTLTPCKANQYRSPETNRCRNIYQDDTPAPCKEGQERNPETNRCRNIVAMTNAGQAVKGAQTVNEGISWYVWLGIGGVIVGVASYAIWEWRVELQKVTAAVKAKFARRKT